MKCAILLPSLGRSHYLRSVVANIHEATREPHEIIFCVGDEHSKRELDIMAESYLDDSESDDKRYVTRMNKLLSYIDDAEVIFFGSDDVTFHPGWLPAALKVMDTGFPVVVVNDLRNPNGTQALVAVEYIPYLCYDDPQAAFHHGYHHNFADTEQFNTALYQGRLARAMDSIVEHHHPNYQVPGVRPLDSTYSDAFKHWHEDSALFHARMAALEDWLVNRE